jgi:hypothetical protein
MFFTSKTGPVMLSAAKHLCASRARPFASLRVTKYPPARLADWTHIQLYEERFQQVMVLRITQS